MSVVIAFCGHAELFRERAGAHRRAVGFSGVWALAAALAFWLLLFEKLLACFLCHLCLLLLVLSPPVACFSAGEFRNHRPSEHTGLLEQRVRAESPASAGGLSLTGCGRLGGNSACRQECCSKHFSPAG